MRQKIIFIAWGIMIFLLGGEANAKSDVCKCGIQQSICTCSALVVNDTLLLEKERLSRFKEYVVNYTLLQNLPLYVERNSCDGAAGIMQNLVKENVFVYTDTEKHDVPCRLLLQLNKKGMITCNAQMTSPQQDVTIRTPRQKVGGTDKKNRSGLSAEIA